MVRSSHVLILRSNKVMPEQTVFTAKGGVRSWAMFVAHSAVFDTLPGCL